MKLIRVTYIALFLIFSLNISFAQLYYKYPLVNYTPKEYGKNQNAQNWAVTQTKEGLIYSGSSNGLIEFDGYKWSFLPARSGFVHSLATDSSNILVVGGESYFGCYLKDSSGKFYYEPLSEKLLPKDHPPFTKVWRTFAGSDRVYFQTNEAIFVYDYKTVNVIKPETSFHLSTFCNNQFYVRERTKGLMKYSNGKLVLIPNSQLFAEYGVFSMQAFDTRKNEILVVTQEKGLFIYNSQTDEFKEYVTENNSIWYNAKILGCIRLANGKFAFNSQFYGSLIFDPKTQQLNFINSAIGLQDDYVIAQFEDRTGNLWLALNSGLSKVYLRSALQSYTSMHGSVHDAIMFGGKLFAATSNGIFVKSDQDADFVSDPGLAQQTVWQLAVSNNKLYAVTDVGLFEYNGKTYSKLKDGNFRKIKFLQNGKILLGGTSDVGLTLYTKELKEEYNFVFEISGDILGIEEEPAKAGAHYYWISTRNAVYKITDDGSPVFKVDVYGEDFGLPNDWKYPFLFNDKIVVGNHSGLYELQKDIKGSFFEPTEFYKFETNQNNFSFIKDYPDRTLAIIDNKPHIIYKKDGSEVFAPFLSIDMGQEKALYSTGKDLYICLDEGIVFYDESKYANTSEKFNCIIRKIATKNDSVIFEGANRDFFRIENGLKYSLNELTVEFTSNYFNQEDKTLYRYKLEGADTSFSAWQADRKVKFNNLHEGSYKLIIQAKNIYLQQSEDLIIEFQILPPWYRTLWAYVLYVVAFTLIVFFAIRIASYRLKQQNRQLDNLVKQRTKEIEHKNEELKEQNEQILHQKQEITDSINYAKRIQNAILPPLKEINASWQDVFVFFQPKDIVSGDFYWYQRISDTEFLIASADCTGHGVPGGFMSMVCSDKLNEAVNHTHEPDEILKMVNRRIKQSLRQDNKEGSTKDGMEIALLKVNIETKIVKYAGANRFLWIIRKGTNEVEEIKPTKAGIGGYTEDTQNFECHTIQFENGDLAYMSTDGYGDQFGGPEGKKLMTKNFKQFLLSVKEGPFTEQQALAADHINKWKAEYEQVDDILVIGIKF